MSMQPCDDPTCPSCSSPQGRSDRANRDSFVANDELMHVLRLLAMNATMSLTDGSQMQDAAEFQCHRILRGQADDDLFVQGLVNGMVVLARNHPQVQTLVAATRQVTPDNGYKARWKEEFGRDFPTDEPEHSRGAVDLGGGMFAMEIDPNNLPDFLKGILGPGEDESVQ